MVDTVIGLFVPSAKGEKGHRFPYNLYIKRGGGEDALKYLMPTAFILFNPNPLSLTKKSHTHTFYIFRGKGKMRRTSEAKIKGSEILETEVLRQEKERETEA